MTITYHFVIMLITCMMMIMFIVQVSEESFEGKSGFFMSAIIIAITSIAEYIGYTTKGPETIIANVIEFSIMPVTAYAIAKAISKKESMKYITIVLLINFILVIISPFTQTIFYYDNNFNYHRGNLFFLYLVASGISFSACVLEITKTAHRFQSQSYKVIGLCALLLGSAIILQVSYTNIIVVKLCTAIVLQTLYSFHMSLMSKIDCLTGLFNQGTYQKNLKDLASKKITIINCDVHKFKSINDTYGHSTGDLCLVLIARALRETFQKYGMIFRVGGDEFVILMLKPYDETFILMLEEEIENKIEVLKSNYSWMPYVDMGHSVYNPYSNVSLEKALKEADESMYNSKKQRNIYEEAYKLGNEKKDDSRNDKKRIELIE